MAELERGEGRDWRGSPQADEKRVVYGADGGACGVRHPYGETEVNKDGRGDNICPHVRKGVNEGALEVSGAREKSEAKQVYVCRKETGGLGRHMGFCEETG